MRGSLAFAGSTWVLFAGIYLLLAGEITTTEILAGVGATTVAVAFAVLLRGAAQRRLRLRVPWLQVIGAPLVSLFPDAGRVALVLLRAVLRRPAGPAGSVIRQPFARHGRSRGCRAARPGHARHLARAERLRAGPSQTTRTRLLLHRLAPAPPSPTGTGRHDRLDARDPGAAAGLRRPGARRRAAAARRRGWSRCSSRRSLAALILVLMTFAFDQSVVHRPARWPWRC